MTSVYIILGIIGLSLGSFLNVVIYRVPKKLSLFGPRSLCPSCQKIIRFYDNVPIISYFILRRKCRYCSAPISWQYPVVEALTAALLLGMAIRFGWQSTEFYKYSILLLVLVPISFIDLKMKIIPNLLVFAGFVLGIAFTLIFQIVMWKEMLIGMVCGGGFMVFLMIVGKLIFKKEAIGMGDVKLLVMTGIYVGWGGALMGIYLGSIIALLIIAIPMILKKIKFGDQIPFGPFIALGTLLYVLVNPDISWYLGLITGLYQ